MSSAPVDRLVAMLDAKPSTDGGFVARCPAHDDRTPSLSIDEGADGRALVHCFAGCSPEAVLAELGLTLRDLYPKSSNGLATIQRPRPRSGPTIEALAEAKALPVEFLADLGLCNDPSSESVSIPYRDAAGKMVAEKSRTALVARHGSLWPKGRPVMPYGRDFLEVARVAGFLVIAEGESDCWTLWHHNLPGLGLPGASTANCLDTDDVRDFARVYVVEETDAAGRRFVESVARRVRQMNPSAAVHVLRLGAKDVNDLHRKDRDGFKATFQRLLDAAPLVNVSKSETRKCADPRTSKSSRIVQLALEHAELFHAPDCTAYADVTVNGHRETWPIESRGFKDFLERLFYEAEAAVAGKQAIADALGTLSGEAKYNGAVREVSVRCARHGEALYVDLGDPAWRAVEVTKGGWNVVSNPPVRFRRARGMLALPEPRRGGSIDALRPFLTIADDDDFHLVVAWMLAALSDRSPYPVLVFEGEQGSGKSVQCRVIRGLVDPSHIPLGSPPRDEHELVIAASNGLVVGFDNVSHLDANLADALCRLSTGGGFRTRQLYADTDEVLFDATRPILCNGIARFIHRADLADRSLVVRLPVLADSTRRPEAEYHASLDAERPAILGSLLDALAGILRELPSVALVEHPRMADFARLGVATERALGWRSGAFLDAYRGKRDEAAREGLESDPIGAALLALLEQRDELELTPGELLVELVAKASETVLRSAAWPKDPAALGKRLVRIAPALRTVGVAFEQNRTSARRSYRIRRPVPEAVTPVMPVTPLADPVTAA